MTEIELTKDLIRIAKKCGRKKEQKEIEKYLKEQTCG